jgi:hypothetical protein
MCAAGKLCAEHSARPLPNVQGQRPGQRSSAPRLDSGADPRADDREYPPAAPRLLSRCRLAASRGAHCLVSSISPVLWRWLEARLPPSGHSLRRVLSALGGACSPDRASLTDANGSTRLGACGRLTTRLSLDVRPCRDASPDARSHSSRFAFHWPLPEPRVHPAAGLLLIHGNCREETRCEGR